MRLNRSQWGNAQRIERSPKEILFRTLERHQLDDRLRDGFDREDVDGFLGYALSVLNRRKSRVGLALENHFEHALVALRIRFERTPVTENNSKPDFLFPGASEYHTAAFPAAHLTMLGVKSTCKDRWRQVLAEADRIDGKQAGYLAIAWRRCGRLPPATLPAHYASA